MFGGFIWFYSVSEEHAVLLYYTWFYPEFRHTYSSYKAFPRNKSDDGKINENAFDLLFFFFFFFFERIHTHVRVTRAAVGESG